MTHEPYYDSELPLRFGLDTERFDVAVKKAKVPVGGKSLYGCEIRNLADISLKLPVDG